MANERRVQSWESIGGPPCRAAFPSPGGDDIALFFFSISPRDGLYREKGPRARASEEGWKWRGRRYYVFHVRNYVRCKSETQFDRGGNAK